MERIFGKKEYQDINKEISKAINEKGFLISVHRGSRGGHVLENNLESYKLYIMKGADMFELDIAFSKDDVLYCFHDTTEYYNLHINDNIETFTSKEIDEFRLYNSIGERTEKHINRFEEVLKTFNNGEFYNIDRAWKRLDLLFPLLDKYENALTHALFKSPVKKEILDFLDKYSTKYMYMPIIYKEEDLELLNQYKNINVVGFEVIIRNNESPFLKNHTIERLKKENYFIWINAIRLSDGDKWSLADHNDDDVSLFSNTDKGWKTIINEYHADIIQTDWPELLIKLRK